MKKVAVCLSGQLRTFKTTHLGILRYFNLVNPDYFVHTWSGNTWRKNNKENANKDNDFEQIDRGDMELMINQVNPKRSRIDKSKKFIIPSSQSQQLSALYSNELKKQYEIEHDFKYDVVIKCRFDIIWNPNEIFNITNVPKNTIFFSHVDNVQLLGYPMANDKMFFGDSETMDKISQIYHTTTKYINDNDIKNKLTQSEAGLYQMSRNLNLEIKETNIDSVIVRKEAMGLNHIDDFDIIEQIHDNFFRNKPNKLI